MFAQFRVPPFTIWLSQQQFALIVIILYSSSTYTITIVHKIFITEIFKLQLFTAHATCLHTRLTEFFPNCLNSLMSAFEGKCLCLHEISINVNLLFTLLLFVYFVYIYPCSIVFPVYLFIPFLYCTVVVVCLLLYPLFYTNVVPIFLFILWSCKQVLCFCFGNFCLAF